MTSMSRKERELQVRRTVVLLAAGQLFAQKGFDDTTIAEIARHAEVSMGTIYQLFESKDALQTALLEEKAGRLLAHTATEATPHFTEPCGVQKMAGVELLFSDGHPEIWLGKMLGRKEREVQKKRMDILDAAAQVFMEKGFHGASMADIAEEAGVATGTLYNFFLSKEELFFTLIEEKVDEFLLYMQAEVNSIPNTVEKITGIIRVGCAFFEANQAFFRLYISTRGGFEWTIQEDLRKRIHGKYAAYVDRVASIIEVGIQEGTLKAMDPKEMAQVLVSMLNACIFEWTINEEGQSLATKAPRIAELFLKGAQRS